MSVINPVISQVIRPVTQPPTKPPKGGGGGNPALTRDLVSWWDMDSASGGSGETDALGNYDLLHAGTGSLSSNTSIFRTGGVSRVTPGFGGGTAYLRHSTGAAAPTDLQPTGDFTFFIWARPADTTTRNLCGVWDEASDERAWRVLHNSTGWRFEICGDGTSGDVTALQSSTGGALTWAFVCVTRKGNTISLYVDDDAAVTGSFSGDMHTSTANFQIGRVLNSADAAFSGGAGTNGLFDTAAIWTRALRGRDINERATSLYANGAGYAYADIGNVHGYASLSAAESSGDNWSDGAIVRCVSGDAVVEFKYLAAAASNHSGLIHRYPYDDAVEISSIDEIFPGDFAAATDPDAWTGFSDNSAGTDGVDYAHDTNGGLTRFRKLTASGRAGVREADDNSTSGTDVFLMVDNITETNSGYGAAHAISTVDIWCYSPTNTAYRRVRFGTRDSGQSGNWLVYHTDFSGTNTDTGQSRTSACRLWLYLKEDKWAAWVDGDATAAATGTTPIANDVPFTLNVTAGVAGSGTSNTLTFGNIINGRFTAA